MLPPVQAGGKDLFGPDDPETLGRASARHYLQHLEEVKYQEEDPMSEEMYRNLERWGRGER